MTRRIMRSFRTTDRASLVALWARVFPDDPHRNRPEAMIDNKLTVQSELLLIAQVDERLVGAMIAPKTMAWSRSTRGWDTPRRHV